MINTTAESFSSSLSQAALVVAHPDDEILWFSSIVEKVALIIVCFLEVPSRQDWTEGRQRAALDFPLANTVFLGLKESETFGGANWCAPVTCEYGLEVTRRENTLRGFNGLLYRENFDALVDELGTRLRGYASVVTHNPWGEYGHEEHVQVFRAVSKLKSALGFDVHFSNYCSSRSYNLMLRHVSGFTSEYKTLATNREIAKNLEQHYRRNNCWTWPYDDYTWFTHECFMRGETPIGITGDAGHWFPLNFIKVDSPQRSESRSFTRRFFGAVGREFNRRFFTAI